MKSFFKFALVFATCALIRIFPCNAQMMVVPGQPLGYCQVPSASLSSAAGFSACVSASFTGTCAGSVLTASAVTGHIGQGWTLVGTGIPTGTLVSSDGTGTGGAGTYNVSQACTASSNSITAVGPPAGANLALIQSETQNIRWRDDGGSPTTSVGMLLLTTAPPFQYAGTMTAAQFIDATAGGLLDASFYHQP